MSSPSRTHDAETKNRSVRIKNLPQGTQEGLLQQVLEKRASIKRVEVFTETNEAIVELENAAVRSLAVIFPSVLSDCSSTGGRQTSFTP